MSFTLPKEINYASLPSLPSGSTSVSNSLLPINGSSFALQSGSLIQWDLSAVGYAIPDSFYIRYSYAVAGGGGATCLLSTPATAPFARYDLIMGSTIVESQSGFNQIQNMLVDSSMGVSEKYGSSLGFANIAVDGKPGMDYFDGRIMGENTSGVLSFPLKNTLLSNASKLIPLGMMPGTRVQITLDSIANVFSSAIAAIGSDGGTGTLAQAAIVVPTSFTLTDVQLCYKSVQFGNDTENMVRSMGDKIFIKSSSFLNSGSALASGSAGSLDAVFNSRLASIKALFLHSFSTSVNKIFDSFELSPNSEVSFTIASRVFPQRPITRANSLLELKQAVGSLLDKTNNSSINPLEFSRQIGTESTIIAPAEYFVGFNTEVLSRINNNDNSVLLSGVSTQSSPISVRLNITATSKAVNLNLIAHYDAILEIDPNVKSCVVRQ